MHINLPKQYELDQRTRVLDSLPKGIKGGVLRDVKHLYPDVRLGESHALARKGAPLNLLCFLYPQTCVFVPPESESRLRARFGLDLDTLVELSRKRIIIPLIGHPTDYANRRHLDSILELEPPAVWPRGLALLKSLDEAERIVTTPEPWEMATLLLLANEILTYPLLFGIGGTPNYPGHRYEEILEGGLIASPAKEIAVIPPDLDILLKGLKIEISGNIDADAISDFHKHGLSKHLWKAVKSFEKVARRARTLEATFDSAERLQTTVKEAVRDVQDSLFERRRMKVQNRIRWYFSAGGASIGFAVGHSVPLFLAAATIGGGVPWILNNLAPIRRLGEWLTDRAMSREYSPGVAHLWHLKSWSERTRK